MCGGKYRKAVAVLCEDWSDWSDGCCRLTAAIVCGNTLLKKFGAVRFFFYHTAPWVCNKSPLPQKVSAAYRS